MLKYMLIVLIIVTACTFALKAFDNSANAAEQNDMSRILENQSLILEKLDVINGKLDVLKMRVRQ